MKTNRKFTVLRLLVLGVVVAGFNAKAASMPALQGKFTPDLSNSLGSRDFACRRVFLHPGQ